MNDSMCRHVPDSWRKLDPITLHFQLGKPFAPLHLIIQRGIAAEIKQNIDIIVIFEKWIEANDVLVVEGSMDLNLALEFLLRSSLGQTTLGDNFTSLYHILSV